MWGEPLKGLKVSSHLNLLFFLSSTLFGFIFCDPGLIQLSVRPSWRTMKLVIVLLLLSAVSLMSSLPLGETSRAAEWRFSSVDVCSFDIVNDCLLLLCTAEEVGTSGQDIVGIDGELDQAIDEGPGMLKPGTSESHLPYDFFNTSQRRLLAWGAHLKTKNRRERATLRHLTTVLRGDHHTGSYLDPSGWCYKALLTDWARNLRKLCLSEKMSMRGQKGRWWWWWWWRWGGGWSGVEQLCFDSSTIWSFVSRTNK